MRKKGLVVFLAVVALQWGGFALLDRYLAPASSGTKAAVAPAAAAKSSAATPVPPPLDARLYDAAAGNNKIAYYDNNDRLVIENQAGKIVSLQNLPGVHFLQWLDNGMTLLYVREIYGRNEVGVFQAADQSIVPLYDLPSTDVEVDQVFKSAYSQTIFMIYRQDGVLYVASYEAIFGWKARSLSYYGFDLQEAWLDDKADTLYLRDKEQHVWSFRNGKLYNSNNVAFFGQDDATAHAQTNSVSQNSELQK